MPFQPKPNANQCDPKQGATFLTADWSLIDVWYALHQNAKMWAKSDPDTKRKCNNTDSGILGTLTETSSELWSNLCRITGMTVYGAVALSWCKDAELSQVWEGWEASGFPLKPLPEYERPARFINPALLPTTNSLLELVKLAENKPLPICAMIVAKGDALDVDLSVNMAANASPQIAAFLKAHIERQQNRTEEQNEMIEIWKQKISGTEWEI
ncbi:hypothetical protein [Halocynthiibacter namhaensis]|uniref:hypothetical protein n=1 Tax=Halocynthiibacter namhaensis TaxID=1290553 RepID=UPI000578FD93|nr:hypothetical protein [Halocynthiibacter namhaensis]